MAQKETPITTDSMHTATPPAIPAAEDDDALRKRLLSRIAVAGVAIVGLLGGLAVYDALNKEPAPALPKMAAVPAEPVAPVAKLEEEKPAEEAPNGCGGKAGRACCRAGAHRNPDRLAVGQTPDAAGQGAHGLDQATAAGCCARQAGCPARDRPHRAREHATGNGAEWHRAPGPTGAGPACAGLAPADDRRPRRCATSLSRWGSSATTPMPRNW